MARPPKDLTGQVFGRLTVLARKDADKFGSALWECLCSCGRTKTLPARNITTGRTRSCGCLQREVLSNHARTTLREANIRHGQSRSGIYGEYQSIRQRCENPQATGYARYGGTGIQCRFRNFEEFKAAVDEIGERPSPRHSLDRTNPFGDYERGNLRWLDPKGQANNRRPRRTKQQIEDEMFAREMAARFPSGEFVEP